MKIAHYFFGLVLAGLFACIGFNLGFAAEVTSSVTVKLLPLNPTNLTASAEDYNKVNISWTNNAPPNADGFSVERKIGSGGIYSQIGTTGTGIAVYSDNSVSGSVNYYYRVRAFLGPEYSGYSNEASATTPVNLPPAKTATTTFVNSIQNIATVTSTDNHLMELSVPSGIYSENLTQITKIYDNATTAAVLPPPSGKNLVGKVYGLNFNDTAGNPVHSLFKPATIVLNYLPPDISEVYENLLAPYARENDTDPWTLISGSSLNTASGTVTFTTSNFSFFSLIAPVKNICGNGILESGEQCDGAQLGGQTCQSKNYTGGTLSCAAGCVFNVSACVNNSTPPPVTGSGGGGGGGGGGGYSPYPSGATAQVTFRGKAYPRSNITLIKDAQVAAIGVSGDDANFELTISGLTPGSYNFGVWAEDGRGNRSIVHQFNISLSSGASTLVSGIFIAPTISADKIEVQRGEPINIFGTSAPSSTIALFIGSEKELIKKILTSEDGSWLYKLNSSELEYGDHSARATAAKDGDLTTFSKSIGFKVGTKTVLTPKIVKNEIEKVDSNGDGRVNLIDFSILAYWYKRSITAAPETIKNKVDINGDGRVDLIDFSILAYYWTG